MSRNYYDSGKSRAFTATTNAKLLNVSSCRYGDDWHSFPHTHSYTELFFIAGGKGQFLIQGQVFPVDVNNLVIINPNILHTELSLNAQPLEYIVLGLEGVELASDDQFCILDHIESSEISSCFRNILREMELMPIGYQEICQAYMEILIIRLMRNAALTMQEDSQSASGNRQCAAIKRYMDLHFKEPLTLEQLAGEAHMNKYYLSHTFKREYGISPINYLIARRIDESKYLLAETDLSMSQIAQILGFSSLSYFSQVFRKANDTSPMDFRQNAKSS